MILKGKRKSIGLLITAAVLVSMLTACGSGGKGSSSSQSSNVTQQNSSQQTDSQTSDTAISKDSILNFQNDKGFARLQQDMKNGDIPIECNVLYDEGGGRPDVTVTDPDTIKDLYGQLADITVGDQSSESVTDSYHHITFRLRNDTYVSFYFEGEDLFCWGKDNYSVSGGKNLWSSVRQLQSTAMKEAQDKTASRKEQADTSKTSTASAEKSDADSTKENRVEGALALQEQDGVETASDTEGSITAAGAANPQQEISVISGSADQTAAADTDTDAKTQTDLSGSAGQNTGNTAQSSGTVSETGTTSQNASGTDTAAQTSSGSDASQSSGTSDTAQAASTASTADAADTAGTASTADAADTAGTASTAHAADAAGTAATAAETAMDSAQLAAMNEAYTEILHAYAAVLAGDKDAFMTAFDQGLYSPEAPNAQLAPDFDERLNYEMFRDLYTNAVGGEVFYGLHDYNADGIQELVIAVGDSEYKIVRAMYTFDGSKAVSLFTGKLTPAYRVEIYLQPDGTFLVHGSGGATSGSDTICRIAENASGLEIIAEYVYDESEYGNLDHYSNTGEVVTEADFYEKYSLTTTPVEGVTFAPLNADAKVSIAPAAPAAE